MWSERLQNLLERVSELRRPPKETYIFSIGSRGYYENPTSDLLGFFLYPQGGHDLGDLLLSSLVELLPDPPALIELVEPPTREYQTLKGNRIDILLNGTDWVIVIENKFRHDTVNPFAEYKNTIKELFPNKRRYFVVISLRNPSIEDWPWIAYREFLAKAREKLGTRLVKTGISKWAIFLREFLIHVEEELELGGTMMDDQNFAFVRDHYREVTEVMNLHEKYIERLIKEITDAGAKMLGADPVRVVRQNWREDGLALRLYPRAGRQHNSVLLVLPEGGFRVQFYVQTDARRPADATRLVFTDAGRFRDWGTEGAFWVFATDEPDVNSAIDTFCASLSVLQNNTQ